MNNTLFRYAILAISLILVVKPMQAQENKTTIQIEGNGRITSSGTLEVRIDDTNIITTINRSGRAEISIPKRLEGPVQLVVLFRGSTPLPIHKAWSQSITLNGSGFLIYTLEEGGRGSARQWPAVTWKANQNKLDVYMNGNIKGSTDFTRGVEPERRHHFEWKKNSNIICDTTFSLPYDVKRTCTCDESNKKVIIN